MQLGNESLVKIKSYGKIELTHPTLGQSVTYPNTHNNIDNDILVIDHNGNASWKTIPPYGLIISNIKNKVAVIESYIGHQNTGLQALNTKFTALKNNTDNWVNTIHTLNTVISDNANIFSDIDTKINTKVTLSGNENINGIKTFNNNIIGNIIGNSSTATKLQNDITIAGNTFTGSESISISAGQIKGIVPLPYENTVQTGSLMPADLAIKVGLIDKDRFLLKADINNNGIAQDISGVITFNHGIIIPTTIDLSHNVTQLADIITTHIHSGKIITTNERLQIDNNKNNISNNTNILTNNITNSIEYPNTYKKVEYQNSNTSIPATYVNATFGTINALNSLSDAIKRLADELHKLNDKKLVYN